MTHHLCMIEQRGKISNMLKNYTNYTNGFAQSTCSKAATLWFTVSRCISWPYKIAILISLVSLFPPETFFAKIQEYHNFWTSCQLTSIMTIHFACLEEYKQYCSNIWTSLWKPIKLQLILLVLNNCRSILCKLIPKILNLRYQNFTTSMVTRTNCRYKISCK